MKVSEWLTKYHDKHNVAEANREEFSEEWLKYADRDDHVSVLWNNLDTSWGLLQLLETADDILFFPWLPKYPDSKKPKGQRLRELAWEFIDHASQDVHSWRNLARLGLTYEDALGSLGMTISNTALHVATSKQSHMSEEEFMKSPGEYDPDEIAWQANRLRKVIRCPW